MGYYIKHSDIDMLSREYNSYRDAVSHALESIDTSVTALTSLSSFRGAAAESIKQYFRDTHSVLTCAIATLAEQLNSMYAREYLGGIAKSPISENEKAELPEDSMKQMEKHLGSIADDSLASAREFLLQARRSVPADMSFHFPDSTSPQRHLKEQQAKIAKARRGVADLESRNRTLFSSESGEFAKLLTALNTFMQKCAARNVAISSYKPGDLNDLLKESGVVDAYLACVKDQDAHSDIVLKNEEDSLERQTARLEEERKEQEKKKMIWTVVGTVAAVLVVVGAAAAVVATAGAATPAIAAVRLAVAGVGMATAVVDLMERGDQLTRMGAGDMRADKKSTLERLGFSEQAEDGVSKTTKAAKTYGKYQTKKMEYEYDKYKNPDIDRRTKAGKEKIAHGKSETAGVIIDEAADQTADFLIDTVVKDEEDNVYAKGAYKIGRKGIDEYKSYAYDPKKYVSSKVEHTASVIGVVGQVTEAVADYHAGKADERLEEIHNTSEEVKRQKSTLRSCNEHTWGFDMAS